jgi:trigger factor
VNVQLNHVSDTRKSLVITLDADEVKKEHAGVVGEYLRLARLPGFRPGHAPAAMVTKRFAKEIAGEFRQKVVSRAYRDGLEKEKLNVLSIVNVEEGSLAPDQPATITVTLDVRPDFALPDYTGLPSEIETTEATDAEVDAIIGQLRAERAEFNAADRPAQKGDYVKLAYEGTLEGKPIASIAPDKQLYGKVPQTWEEVEGSQEGHLPGLGHQLAGLKTGDKKTVAIAFPAEFPALPALAGKTADYALEILEVRERVIPPLDDAFFKSQQVDNLEGLKDQVRANLKLQKEHMNRMAQRRQVTEALAAKVDFAVPQSLVDTETQATLRQIVEENMRRGVPEEQLQKDKKGLVDGARQAAEKRVKVQLLLARIAEAEKIESTESDVENFIHRESARSNQRPEKFAKELGREPDRMRSVQQSIIFDKAVDFLVEKARVVVKAKPAA